LRNSIVLIFAGINDFNFWQDTKNNTRLQTFTNIYNRK
jgi:hypothetical protein